MSIYNRNSIVYETIQETTHYSFKENHDIGLNILPEYYKILIEFSEQNVNKYLEYLYCKYYKNMLRKKIAHTKKSATAEYQPKTRRYIQVKIKKISPYIWDKYKDLKRISGYSISFIIRIFLEWEMIERNEAERLERGYPLVERIGIPRGIEYRVFQFRHNYVGYKRGNHQGREFYWKFKEKFG